jgi:hypothetical protein
VLANPSRDAFRCMEAWTAKISSDLNSETSDLSFGKERGGSWRNDSNCGTSMEGLRLHKSTDQRPRHHFWWFFWPRGVSVTTQ